MAPTHLRLNRCLCFEPIQALIQGYKPALEHLPLRQFAPDTAFDALLTLQTHLSAIQRIAYPLAHAEAIIVSRIRLL